MNDSANAALVEEASAASETMTEQAKSMMDLVGFFQVGNAVVASAPVAGVPKSTPTMAPVESSSSVAASTGSRPVGQ